MSSVTLAYNGLQLPVVGVWNTQLSITTNGCLKIQNFLLPRPRQLLVGAVSSMVAAHSTSQGTCLLFFYFIDLNYFGLMSKPLNHFPREERIKIMMGRVIALVSEREGEIVGGEYQTKRSTLRFKCKHGHVWETQVQSILNGTWCRKCWDENGAGKHIKLHNGLELAKEMARLRGGDCLSEEYKTGHLKLDWICANGHKWSAAYSDIKKGTWCPRCGAGIRERLCRHFIEEITGYSFPKCRPKWLINSLGNQMELDGFSSRLSIAFEHNGLHHYKKLSHFQRREESLERRKKDDELKVSLCRKNKVSLIVIPYTVQQEELVDYIYSALKKAMPNGKFKLPSEVLKRKYVPSDELSELKKIALSKGGICLSAYYGGIFTKCRFRCKKGHEWEAIPSSIKSGDSWCPKCKPERIGDSNRKHSVEAMQALAKAKGGFFLDSEFKSVNNKHRWRCAKGHEWSIAPTDIMKGHWCRVCFREESKDTIEEMQQIAKERGGRCLSSEYINSGEKLIWSCQYGHEWSAKPGNVKNKKSWCPKCARKKK